MTTNTTAVNNGAYLATDVSRKGAKLALRIMQAINEANGRIVNIQVLEADGELWLYVNGGKREVIE